MTTTLTVNGLNVKCQNIEIGGTDLDDCVLLYAEKENGNPLTREEIESVSDKDVMDLWIDSGNYSW